MIDFKKYPKFTIFFGIIFILNFLFFTHMIDYRVVAKPMIMASLIGFYISVERRQSNAFVLAMIFALLGDVFLLFTSESFFLIGLGCFLVMQLLYAYIFYTEYGHDTKKLWVSIIAIGTICVSALAYLWTNLGSMKLPVVVYCMAISMMVIAAINRRSSLVGYMTVIIGVILFMISDTVLGISKFGGPIAGNDYIVIGTYMAAQFLIVRGMIDAHAQE